MKRRLRPSPFHSMTTLIPVSKAGLVSAFALGLVLLAPQARSAGILRDIYGTAPGNNGYHLTTASDSEGGAQAVHTSATTFYSAPQSLRLKFLPGIERNIVGLRFITPAYAANPMNLAPDRGTTFLEFWINPGESPSVSKLSVGLVSDNGAKVESRLPISAYLAPADRADKWTFISIPLRDFPATGFVYDGHTKESSSAPFDWTQVVGINFSCDTRNTLYYDPSVDDIRLYSTVDP